MKNFFEKKIRNNKIKNEIEEIKKWGKNEVGGLNIEGK